MTNEQLMTAREFYQAYLRSEVTPQQIDKRAQDLNESLKGGTKPRKE